MTDTDPPQQQAKMTISRYRHLIEQLGAHFRLPLQGSLHQATTMQVNGVELNLYHGGLIVPDSVLLYCEFGPLPRLQREQVLLRLLETNMYLFNTNCPAFTYQAQKDSIFLICRFSLSSATLESTLELFDFLVSLALRWRRDYYLFGEDEAGI
ncbi:CesT family type III secretion system chaperone [uncultured Herbaspirillum sp.]|uniref:CesT family type III secretion system chaperone n=1 Tax=uncultured Herbaspirillum sp. TaxID=160236 RepID=UPI002586212E|nr:CesT family type III secretion system chaperone [uncultured Herbaspirillum sp.]